MPFTVSGRVTDYALAKHDIPKRDRRFSLSYSQEAGWDDPDSTILVALQTEADGVEFINHEPIPQAQGAIPPTFHDAPAETWVASSVAAFVWTIAENVKWETTEPLGAPVVADPRIEF